MVVVVVGPSLNFAPPPHLRFPNIWVSIQSRGIKRDKQNGTNGAKVAVFFFFFFRRFSQIFADFRFSWEL